MKIARCPTCGRRSRHVHSRYTRRITDEPLGARNVVVHLRVRRFLCRNTTCPRRTFAEQAPVLAPRYARRSTLLTGTLQHIGVALGGRPGARLSGSLRRPVSRTTLLRLVRGLPLPEAPPVRVLGVDDWAKRRRHSYGTILVDLERHRLVDVLPDRTADTLASWLQGHPGVEVVSRDRSGAYADGATRGAPAALQVADRFHLTRNLSEALDRCFNRHRRVLKQVGGPDESGRSGDDEAGPTRSTPAFDSERQRKRAIRQGRYAAIRDRYLNGATIAALAREFRLDWRTTRKYAHADQYPERRPPQRPPLIAPYEAYLRRRWTDGCRTGTRLYREIVGQGYRGSRIQVSRYLTRLRLEPVVRPSIEETAAQPPECGLTPQDATWLVMRPVGDRTDAERRALGQVCGLSPEIEAVVSLGGRFLAMLRDRPGAAACDAWVADADASGIPELRRFAIKLKQDLPAVRAACREPWTNGQTEGQVNRLKLLKRQMFGRAGFDLLRRRLLLAS
jgi:transposase